MNKICEFKECSKQYEAKRPASRFCSDNCRVREHKLNGKKEKGLTTKAKIDIIFNKVQEFGTGLPTANPRQQGLPITEPKPIITHIPTYQPVQAQIRDFDYYRKKQRECESEEEFLPLRTEYMASPYLTQKQKQILLTNNF